MATDFNKGNSADKGFIISARNTPTRVGDRISTISEMEKIPSPWKGMLVFVEDEGLYYIVTSLKAKKVGPLTIEDSVVDQYRVFDQDGDEQLVWVDVQ